MLSNFILNETRRVLSYPRLRAVHRLAPEGIREHLRYLEGVSDLVEPMEGPSVVPRDPDDDPVVYTALAGAADVICTADKHFYDPAVLSLCARYGVQILDDVALLGVLRPAGPRTSSVPPVR